DAGVKCTIIDSAASIRWNARKRDGQNQALWCRRRHRLFPSTLDTNTTPQVLTAACDAHPSPACPALQPSCIMVQPLSSDELNNTVGCIFLGILFQSILWGFAIAQTLYYFYEYPHDDKRVQLLFIWVCLIKSHANRSGLSQFTKYYIRTVCTLMDAERRRIYLCTLMGILALLSFLSVYELSITPAVTCGVSHAEVSASLQTVSAVVTDVFITVTLSVVLRGKRTGIAETTSLIAKLVVYVLNRGIITALLQLVIFIIYIALRSKPNQVVWAVVYFMGSKSAALAVPTLMASTLARLNIRHWLRDSMPEQIEVGYPRSRYSGSTST
ncbi:uncharacterized protein B0H18DRAFT_987793, partial [Fomitopsis serialis]|uniref:uncharacterized protein n=1 Tax=Fomitopsis serialis TaxID=139415 RepID=UPI002008B94E